MRVVPQAEAAQVDLFFPPGQFRGDRPLLPLFGGQAVIHHRMGVGSGVTSVGVWLIPTVSVAELSTVGIPTSEVDSAVGLKSSAGMVAPGCRRSESDR